MLLINHHHLYYFWVAAREKSIAKACAVLHLAQPTVSAQIIKLEKELGKPLLIRQRRGLELTEDGKLVFDYASRIFDYSRELVDALQDRPGGRRIRVQIGIVDQVSKEIAQTMLTQLFKDMPEAMATVHEGQMTQLLAEAQSHALDVMLTNADVPAAESALFDKTEVGRLSIDFYAARPLAQKIKRFPTEWAKVPLLLPTRASPIWLQIERFLNAHHSEPRVLAEVQDAELLRRLGIQGFGVVPLDRIAARDAEKSGDLVRLNAKPTGIEETLRLINRRRHHLNPVAQRLIERFRLNS